MVFLKRITALTVFICMTLCLCSCGTGSRAALIYMSVEQMPDTLDPQVAGSDSELIICRNIYEGLFRQNEKGEIVPAAAANYNYENLTYTFSLRDNLMWADGESITADDFVFGIKRALLPETRAPYAKLLYAISGAPQVNTGAGSADILGISATDAKTVKITLTYDDKNFLKTLSMPVSMPCREDFFLESIGKYGLEKDCVLSCGSYRLARWNKEDFGIRLYSNDEYTGEFKTKNGGVFISRDKEKTTADKLLSGDADIALVASKYLPKIENEGIKTETVQNICWVLSLGGEFSQNIRRAFCECISPDIYVKSLPSGFSLAASIFPGCLESNEVASPAVLPYNPEDARSIISSEIKGFKNKKFPQTTLVFTESEPMRPAITEIVGDWQKNLSTFINIKPTDKSLEGELKEHTMPLAVFPVKADSTIEEYLNKFKDGYYNGYELVPIAYENTTVAYLENLSGVSMNAIGGYIDFSGVIKK